MHILIYIYIHILQVTLNDLRDPTFSPILFSIPRLRQNAFNKRREKKKFPPHFSKISRLRQEGYNDMASPFFVHVQIACRMPLIHDLTFFISNT